MTPKTPENSHFWQKGSALWQDQILSRRKFYDLLNDTDGEEFLAYYGERKLILRVAFERYLRNHPELRRRV